MKISAAPKWFRESLKSLEKQDQELALSLLESQTKTPKYASPSWTVRRDNTPYSWLVVFQNNIIFKLDDYFRRIFDMAAHSHGQHKISHGMRADLYAEAGQNDLALEQIRASQLHEIAEREIQKVLYGKKNIFLASLASRSAYMKSMDAGGVIDRTGTLENDFSRALRNKFYFTPAGRKIYV